MTLISVIVPYYQHERFIGQAISSLLKQTITDIEVIAVDDASTDEGPKIVDDIADNRVVSIHRNSNGGPSAALNEGLRHVKSPYIALQGGDDVSEQWRLEHQLSLLQHRNAQAVFSAPQLIDENGRPMLDPVWPVFFRSIPEDVPGEMLRRLIVDFNWLCAPSAFLETQAVKDTGRFDEDLVQLQDYDYWLRMAGRGHRLVVGRRRVVRYRRHSGNLSRPDQLDVWRRDLLRCLYRAITETPGERFAEAFPAIMPPDVTAARPVDRAIVALAHNHTLVQSIGRALLVELWRNTISQNHKKGRARTTAEAPNSVPEGLLADLLSAAPGSWSLLRL